MSNAPGQGRKAKPTALKLIQGNPGKQPLNKREPKPKIASKSPPVPRDFIGTKKHQGKIAAKIWKKLAPELYNMGLLTTIDVHQLKQFCETFERAQEIMEMIAQSGPIVRSAAKTIKLNPLYTQLAITQQQLNRLASEFGLSPAARSRIEATKPDDGYDESDPYADF